MKRAAGLVVLVAALAMVARQPVTSSWARYADADAIYAGSGVSILAGDRTKYFDHPGFPLQALAALTFGGQYAGHLALGGDRGLDRYAEQTMLDLDRTRVWFRGWAILLYLGGAAAAFLLGARLFSSTALGLAAGLAWVAAPGIGQMSIQLRPDVALVGLLVVLVYLIATGAERRDPLRLALAGLVLGFAVTIKLHAAGMLVPLLIATLRVPPDGWWGPFRERFQAFISARRRWLVAAAITWLLAIAALNIRAWPFGPAPSQRLLVAEIVVALGLYWAAALLASRFRAPAVMRRVIGTFPALVVSAVVVGVAIGLSLVISDAGIALQTMKETLAGGGLNADIPLLERLRDNVGELGPFTVLAYVGLAVAITVVAIRRRRFWPPVILLGAAALAVMAAGRGGASHYDAPAFMVAVLVVLWLAAEGPWARVLQAAAVAVAALASLGAIADAPEQKAADACGAAVEQARERLRPGEVALAEGALGLPDLAYQQIVEVYVSLSPEYPYRFLSADGDVAEFARAGGLRLSYAVGQTFADVASGAVVRVGKNGPFSVRSVYRDGACGVVELGPA